jgi:GGDEF domain-containing protein
LLEQAPLDDAPAILATDLTRDGPRLCDAVLRAISDETDLRRLEPGGVFTSLAARVGELAGATAPAAVSRAVDALVGVIWSAVREELRAPDADLVSELTERLSLIGELVRSAALERAPGPAVSAAPSPPPGPPPAPPPGPPPPIASSRPQAPPPPPSEAVSPEAAAAARAWPGLSDLPTLDPSRALWVGALDDEISRTSRGPLSLLLAELEDSDRVSAVASAAEARSAFNRFTGAVRSAMRRQDILVSESDARAWIIARDTGRGGAHALGGRIAAAVRASEPWQGAPLVASVGVAVFGEDGRSSAQLMEAAEEARFAASARGLDIVGREEPEDPTEPDEP